MALITLIMTLIVLVVTLLSCISDVRSLRIPNWHSLAIFICFFPAWFATPQLFNGIGDHLGAMAIMLAVGYVLFACGVMGGGDSKLGMALGLWLGLEGLLPFLFYMALAGGVIGVFSLIIAKRKPFKKLLPGSWLGQAQAGKNAIPYGLAISFGAWAAFSHSGFIHNQLNEVFSIIH